MHESTNSYVVLTEKGYDTPRSIHRLPEEQMWDRDLFAKVKGLPWSRSTGVGKESKIQKQINMRSEIQARPLKEVPEEKEMSEDKKSESQPYGLDSPERMSVEREQSSGMSSSSNSSSSSDGTRSRSERRGLAGATSMQHTEGEVRVAAKRAQPSESQTVALARAGACTQVEEAGKKTLESEW